MMKLTLDDPLVEITTFYPDLSEFYEWIIHCPPSVWDDAPEWLLELIEIMEWRYEDEL